MSGSHRGPSGSAPLPPPWLNDIDLPLIDSPEGTIFYRIHRLIHAPVHFSGAGGTPIGRFDSPRGLFWVLYMAPTFAGAFAETLLRIPQRRLVSLEEITMRGVSALTFGRSIRLVDLHGAGLQMLGTDNAISTGPYEPCGAWADALYNHRDKPDGIIYASRHDPQQPCIALFSRPDLGIKVPDDPQPLEEMVTEVADLLRRYGKGLIR